MISRTTYITVVEAQTYFDGRLNTEVWDEALTTDRNKALIQASVDVDKLAYIGEKTSESQEHEFPRGRSDLTGETELLGRCDTDNVPFDVKYAVCEQALALLEGFEPAKEIDNLTATGQWYGEVRTTFDRSTVPMHLKAGLCAQAWQFLTPFFRDPREISVLRV